MSMDKETKRLKNWLERQGKAPIDPEGTLLLWKTLAESRGVSLADIDFKEVEKLIQSGSIEEIIGSIAGK